MVGGIENRGGETMPRTRKNHPPSLKAKVWPNQSSLKSRRAGTRFVMDPKIWARKRPFSCPNFGVHYKSRARAPGFQRGLVRPDFGLQAGRVILSRSGHCLSSSILNAAHHLTKGLFRAQILGSITNLVPARLDFNEDWFGQPHVVSPPMNLASFQEYAPQVADALLRQ